MSGEAATDDVFVHLHFAMRGAYPLRLLDCLFCEMRALVVEYDYITGVGLVGGTPARRATEFAEAVRDGGLPAALDAAERIIEIPYSDLTNIRIYDGGWLGREKIVLRHTAGSSVTARVHAAIDPAAFIDALRPVVEPHSVTVQLVSGMGLRDALPIVGRSGRRN
ncbi:hypothetical protein [Natronomonas sp. EA1]|uniref:hypothetical protein n=1 Tax=Natronomonas sp. EA1 TaxID=3421655 RepID=UPI003EBE338D